MTRVLCFSYERLFYPNGILSGPGYRLWEIASALQRKGHKITIAELDHKKDYKKDNIEFISWDTERLHNIDKEFDVAFIPLSAYVHFYFNKIKKIPTIVDLSTPISVESMIHTIGDETDFFLYDGLLPTAIALSQGDFFICSNNNQKYFYLGMFTFLGLRKFDSSIIQLAPLAPDKSKLKTKKGNILTKVIGKNKSVLLFMGGLYNWYDYQTPILAMRDIIKKHENVALIFIGGFNPNIPELTKANYENAISLAKKNKLYNRYVYFMDWLPPEDKLKAYTESDIAVVTSNETIESALSYRMRIVDFLQGFVPVICTRNDELSNLVEKKRLGLTIQVRNKKQLAERVIYLLNNRELLREYKDNIKKFIISEFNIEKTIKPINEFCSKPKFINRRLKLNYLDIIQNLKQRIKDLEYMKDDKISINQNLIKEINHLELRFHEVNEEKNHFIQQTKNEIESKNKIIEEQAKIIKKQNEIPNSFYRRNS